MTIKPKLSAEARKFFKELINPIDEQVVVETRAYSIMGRYLVKIEKILEERDLTQKNLAQMIGTTESFVSQIFNMNKLINLKMLAKIEQALQIKFSVSVDNTAKQVLQGKPNVPVKYIPDIQKFNVDLNNIFNTKDFAKKQKIYIKPEDNTILQAV